MIDKREITPGLLAQITVLLFRRISIRAVLEERLPYDRLSANDIARIMVREDKDWHNRSIDQCEAIAHSVIGYVSQKTAWQSGARDRNPGRLNVFDLLILTLQDLLLMNQNRIECHYQHIDSWRLLVRYLGEELPLALQYARWDHEHRQPMRASYDRFDWAYVASHNNKQLNAMVHRGISEHHSHLWGSTPYFHVSWVNLMNDLSNSRYQKSLRNLNPEPWSAEKEQLRKRGFERSDDDRSLHEHYWEIAQARAAWIRFYLCERLTGRTSRDRRPRDLQNIRQYENWRVLLMSRNRLQSELDAYAHLRPDAGDYALALAKLQNPLFAKDYHALIGERWLYYQIFRDYSKPEDQRMLTFDDYNLFFVYFMIRLRIRNHMVQSNEYMGFDNFQAIERRKAYFVNDQKSERALTRLAINDTLRKPYVRELEVRISPITEQVGRIDSMVRAGSGEDSVERFLAERSGKKDPAGEDLRDRYYYVFHFLKRRDPSQEADASYERSENTGRICRHEWLRSTFMEQAREIIRFREQEPKLARRVLGIDAASRELGCRPEVFGNVYRMLGDHQHTYGGMLEESRRLPALGKTFHVGEDFPDVVNGLRAIDEAISFLALDCGDRLGHAIVLGVNVREWYEKKQEGIFVSIQDRMDDLAWLYHALVHFSIPDAEPLKEHLRREFEYWFNIVYRNSINADEIRKLMESARKNWYDTTDEDRGRYCVHPCHFDIMGYYRSWTLRGDDPQCYIDGYFKKPRGCTSTRPEEQARVCRNYPPTYEDRYISEYSLLNYLYQFDARVRREGARIIRAEVTEAYIRAVEAVQLKMRYRVAKKGIAIETNPTSNVLIGGFRKYEKHPILAFYNRGLPVEPEEEEVCAQLQVSVNTDDSGVFYTDLETEYALLASSVEQIQDENGQPRFKKTDIYTWLDHIRAMGNDQTFRYWDDPTR